MDAPNVEYKQLLQEARERIGKVQERLDNLQATYGKKDKKKKWLHYYNNNYYIFILQYKVLVFFLFLSTVMHYLQVFFFIFLCIYVTITKI